VGESIDASIGDGTPRASAADLVSASCVAASVRSALSAAIDDGAA